MTDSEPVPATPRLAATVLLLRDDPLRVLMVRRAERREDAFSSALVFPGGVVDPEDRAAAWLGRLESGTDLPEEERALRIAACRETFEEVGILLGEPPPRKPRATPGAGFTDIVRATETRLPLARLVRFGHWITPETAPRRFDTHFYLCRAPDGVEARCDGRETVAHEWVSPRALRDRADAGAIHFPTWLNLLRLGESDDVASALAAAAAREPFTVTPRAELRDGRHLVTIPAEAGYGVTEDWRRDLA